MWPAHHTLFSHLVSDSSLAELHQFAAAAQLSGRAFDGDHYDVPEARHEQLVGQGAVPVTAGELIRRLRASGLRVPARERPSHVQRVLQDRWRALAPDAPELGTELLNRWSESHRRYHTPVHLLDVLTALDQLSGPGGPPKAVVLAAWFHDAVYDMTGADEEASAQLATDRLHEFAGNLRIGAGNEATLICEVARLVLLTRSHSPQHDDTGGALLCDADLAVLGRSPARYARYAEAIRAEYAHVTEPDWQAGRSAVVHHLLDKDPLFHTRMGARRWEQAARQNLAGELTALQEHGR